MVVFWFRRDLRLTDNVGLNAALQSGFKVLPIFVFDENILDGLERDDPRVQFIYEQLHHINEKLKAVGSGLKILQGNPISEIDALCQKQEVTAVYTNRDYEPYGIDRDEKLKQKLAINNVTFHNFKDHLIFEPGEILKADGTPYTVFTPFKNLWNKAFESKMISEIEISAPMNFQQFTIDFPSLAEIGFSKSSIKVKNYQLSDLAQYDEKRDIPHLDGTSNLSPHLRFGTISIRQALRESEGNKKGHEVFKSELIWREFFMHILYHFPHVATDNFRAKYDGVRWIDNEEDFQKWCEGKTGYPIVDAGMRQLNETGYMHNRVRMITAGFLCKHLLIDWRWGEAYFAKKLLDFELSSNNGNWQWASGTGCDAAPYFRIFNPYEQTKKFDPKLLYTKQWVKELDTTEYPQPIVEHKFARERALQRYKEGINNA